MRQIAALVLLAALTAGTAQAGDLQRVRAGLAQLAATNRLSGDVLIARNGRIVFQHAYGLADRTTRRPNDLHTRFNLASLGKPLTAVAVARLVEQHRLRFGDAIGRYLPALPPKLRRITVAQLLDHSSGLGDFFGAPGYDALRPTLTSLDRYLPLIVSQPLSPAGRFTYSNSGYLLLGLIIERVSGQSYYTFLQRQVFDRAGMTRSGCFAPMHLPPDTAIGYSSGAANTSTLPPRGTSAGGCYSTAGDLLRFTKALLSGRLVGTALARTLTTPKVTLEPTQRYGYGFGLRYARTGAPPTIWHNGGSPGVGADLEINRQLGLTVIVLANRDYPVIRPAVDLVLNDLRIP